MEREHWKAAEGTFENLGEYKDSALLKKRCMRLGKEAKYATPSHKVTTVLHAIINDCFVLVFLATKDLTGILSFLGIIELFAVPYLTKKFDKSKPTVEIIIIILFSFFATVFLLNNADAKSRIIIMHIILAISIFLIIPQKQATAHSNNRIHQ